MFSYIVPGNSCYLEVVAKCQANERIRDLVFRISGGWCFNIVQQMIDKRGTQLGEVVDGHGLPTTEDDG